MIALFQSVLMDVTLPIVALVAVGFVMQRRMHFDVATLNRALMFIFVPAFLVHYLSSSRLPIGEVLPTTYFTVVQFLVLIPVGWIAALLFRYGNRFAAVIALTTVYANVGNFGIPLVQLAFPERYILHQSVITSLVTILIVTVGIWLLAPPERGQGFFNRLKLAFEMPVIPAVCVGLLLRGFEVTLPTVIGKPVEMIGSVFAPLALVALGAQLGDRRPETLSAETTDGPPRGAGALTLAVVLKLLVAPAITWGLALFMGLPGDLLDLVVVASATPVGVILAVFCLDFRREPKFVGQAILISTLLSPITVTAWIIAMRLT
ncbi:MAG: AEC family transporter [Pseudomonadota bacterium]